VLHGRLVLAELALPVDRQEARTDLYQIFESLTHEGDSRIGSDLIHLANGSPKGLPSQLHSRFARNLTRLCGVGLRGNRAIPVRPGVVWRGRRFMPTACARRRSRRYIGVGEIPVGSSGDFQVAALTMARRARPDQAWRRSRHRTKGRRNRSRCRSQRCAGIRFCRTGVSPRPCNSLFVDMTSSGNI
jgi:hypothetical protein